MNVNCNNLQRARPNANYTFQKLTFLTTNADVYTPDKKLELKARINEEIPDIIMIQEVKPKNYTRILTKVEYELEQYDLEWENMNEKDVGRGLITYIRKGINYKQIFFDFPFTEYLAMVIEVNKKEKLLIVNIYHSPNSTEENTKLLNDVIMKIANENKYDFVFIAGDGNFKHINWQHMTCSTSVDSKDFVFLETVKDAFFDQHITQPTRGRGSDKPSTLDLILTKNDDAIDDIQIEAPLGKSDHAVITASLACNYAPKPVKKTRFQYDKADYAKLKGMIPKNWDSLLRNKDLTVNEMWNIFKEKLTEAINESIPKKTVVLNGKVRRTKKLDRKSLSKIKRKYRLWDSYIKTGDGKKYLEYCRVRNQVRAITRRVQKELEKKVAKEVKSNPKKFWQYIRNKTKSRPTIPDLLLNDDDADDMKDADFTKNDQEKANRFNEFFSSVFNAKTFEPDTRLPLRTEETLVNVDINYDKVLKILLKLKTGKSPGPDGLHPRVLKEVATEIAPALTTIFKKSMETSSLPDDWLLANVSPIYKKDNKHVAGNYRPVSLTSIVCKMFETLIREEVMDYLKKNKLLSPKQFGFLSGRSTTLQLLQVLDKWTSILDRGGAIDVIYFDFMKAFDKVSHGRLLQKLRSYGINGKLHSWIGAFLSDRKQRVTVNGSYSSWESVTSGVPQGSVLGPLLFVIFIDDMPEVVDENSLLVMFADDAKLSREVPTIEDKEITQEDINHLHGWAKENEMSHHPGKCHVLKVGEREITLHDLFNPYRLGETILKTVANERDLGVIIDQDLTFEDHLSAKIKKANQIIGIIRRSFQHLDEDMFLQLYKSMVRPHLEYANQVWSPRLEKHVTLIENVQRRATKLVPGLKDLDYEDRLKKLKLPTLAYRRLRGDLIEVYKIMTGKYDPDACEGLIVRREGERSTGHPHKIFKERPSRDLRKYGFPHRVVDLWNRRRMGGVVKASTVKDFECRLDMVLSNQDIVYDYKASTKFMTLKNVVFDDSILEEENEDAAS